MRDYKNIKAWQKANQLAKEIYFVTRSFPAEEKFGLVSQLRRAIVSVAANIAEGANRQHHKDYLNFLYNAKASLAEVEYLLHLSHDLEFLTPKHLTIDKLCQESLATLTGLIKAVESEVVAHSSMI